MWEDPIVKDVRDIRREIEAECGNDFDQIFARAVAIQKKYNEPTLIKSVPSEKEKEPVAIESA